jgi:hypothetical protein
LLYTSQVPPVELIVNVMANRILLNIIIIRSAANAAHTNIYQAAPDNFKAQSISGMVMLFFCFKRHG